MPESSRRGPGSEATREKLNAAAAELIGELGWGRVTTRAVAERAGVPHGAVSYHFRGKQELLTEACLAAFGNAVPFEEFASLGGIDDLIDFIAVELEQGLADNTVLTRLMFEAMREAERDDRLRERLQAMMADYRQAVVTLVQADQARGVLSPAFSAEGVAIMLAAVGDGLLLHALLDPGLDIRGGLTALRTVLTASQG
ncbi:hypothetical protein GCM10011492_12080 [Flexivirga endophytica]|uniref:HTH tetR-type domain-containing protein n=1 Tax=Flexivirga endophytica TaxID=1849103 RepID=A0A916T000_9MICO|nr:TetR/AcrR family transcriptional regulator [Flexivirga endophytica]GGB23783.1 hypothetical protein GCM10011492_12080 [Flexivirga endophytica]GHB57728.1 hypothetical protein GCM10008112_28620 [Flexivirga endophytica]